MIGKQCVTVRRNSGILGPATAIDDADHPGSQRRPSPVGGRFADDTRDILAGSPALWSKLHKGKLTAID